MCAELVFKISVNWHKSYMWGANPRAEVWAGLAGVRHDYTTGDASGCGYDKESAAVDQALKANPLMQTLLLWPRLNVKGQYGDKIHGALRKRDYGYALRFDGMGMSELKSLLEQNGFSCTEMHGDAFDGYEFRRDMPESFVKLVA